MFFFLSRYHHPFWIWKLKSEKNRKAKREKYPAGFFRKYFNFSNKWNVISKRTICFQFPDIIIYAFTTHQWTILISFRIIYFASAIIHTHSIIYILYANVITNCVGCKWPERHIKKGLLEYIFDYMDVYVWDIFAFHFILWIFFLNNNNNNKKKYGKTDQQQRHLSQLVQLIVIEWFISKTKKTNSTTKKADECYCIY